MACSLGKGIAEVARRNYKCSNRMIRGICPTGDASSVQEELLDRSVLFGLCQAVLTPERVQQLVEEVRKRRETNEKNAIDSLAALRKQKVRVEKQLSNLWAAVAEHGLSSSEFFKAQESALNDERQAVAALIAAKERSMETLLQPMTVETATKAAAVLSQKLTTAPPEVSKRYIRALISKVRVGPDAVEIIGPKAGLADLAAHRANDPSVTGVRGFNREWRTGWDSNPR